jgi:hypothetical protein
MCGGVTLVFDRGDRLSKSQLACWVHERLVRTLDINANDQELTGRFSPDANQGSMSGRNSLTTCSWTRHVAIDCAKGKICGMLLIR